MSTHRGWKYNAEKDNWYSSNIVKVRATKPCAAKNTEYTLKRVWYVLKIMHGITWLEITTSMTLGIIPAIIMHIIKFRMGKNRKHTKTRY